MKNQEYTKKVWWVEVDGDWTDPADCSFKIVADTYKEAWRKAISLEPKRRIIKVYESWGKY